MSAGMRRERRLAVDPEPESVPGDWMPYGRSPLPVESGYRAGTNYLSYFLSVDDAMTTRRNYRYDKRDRGVAYLPREIDGAIVSRSDWEDLTC